MRAPASWRRARARRGSPEAMARPDGRAPDQLRPIVVTRDYLLHPEGSVLVEFGATKVICTASVEDKVPPFLKGQGLGWVTAEYAMLPRSTNTRTPRENRGPSGRSQEVQRLVGRALRAVIDRGKMGERTVWVDCDVIQADGGTRTAAITGGFVAVADALAKANAVAAVRDCVAAVSVGIVGGVPVLDLNYLEDSGAAVDMNVVMTGAGEFVEVQGTAEQTPFGRAGRGDLPIELLSLADIPGATLPEETARTYADNALLKARAAQRLTGCAALGDDSGLEVDALGGAPGVHSARFGGAGLDDAGRVALLLERLRAVPAAKRTARFRCVIALVDEGGGEHTVEGVAEGEIAAAPRGAAGFGYDPVFYYPPRGRTFGELTEREKEGVSHRALAARAARALLSG